MIGRVATLIPVRLVGEMFQSVHPSSVGSIADKAILSVQDTVVNCRVVINSGDSNRAKIEKLNVRFKSMIFGILQRDNRYIHCMSHEAGEEGLPPWDETCIQPDLQWKLSG